MATHSSTLAWRIAGMEEPGRLPSVHGILQARILERVAFPSSRESSHPRDQTWVLCIAGEILYQLSHK